MSNHCDQLYNQVLTEQNNIQNLMKNEEDEKKSKKYERDLVMISNLLVQLTRYSSYVNKKANQ